MYAYKMGLSIGYKYDVMPLRLKRPLKLPGIQMCHLHLKHYYVVRMLWRLNRSVDFYLNILQSTTKGCVNRI